jgi:hypothetical protein
MLSQQGKLKIRAKVKDKIFVDKKSMVEDMALSLKVRMIEEFNSHPVTQEILSGPRGSNISGTLTGSGNLFSFIGFEKNSNPITPILEQLNLIQISLRKSYDNIFLYIRMPTPEDIWKVTPMPWQEGRSWAKGIESGISGLNYYLYFENPNPSISQISRSGTGVQSGKQRSSSRYVPVKYISELLKKYKTKFSSIGKRSKFIFTEIN